MKNSNKSPDLKRIAVPKAMQVQLARLFGSESREVRRPNRTTAQWRKTLKAVLREMDRYIAKNVDTDEPHKWMLLSGLAAAHESLKEDDFWPGYAEGLTRLALVLMGDYPDHGKQMPGRKKMRHYDLGMYRSCLWVQTPEQRFRTVMMAGNIGYPKLSASPQDALNRFRRQYGFKPDHADFMEWYRTNFPRDYAAIFR